MEPDLFELVNIIKISLLLTLIWSIFDRDRYSGKCKKHLCELKFLSDGEGGLFYCPECEKEQKNGSTQKKT